MGRKLLLAGQGQPAIGNEKPSKVSAWLNRASHAMCALRHNGDKCSE